MARCRKLRLSTFLRVPDAPHTTGWDVTTGPGVTALGLAAARAVESGRPDRLIDDPFARVLYEDADAGLPMPVTWPSGGPVSDTEALYLHGSRYIGLRTRFYDDVVIAATNAGIRQVVLLGAGLDTRAYRLELPPEAHVLEVDQPGVLGFKDRVLAKLGATPACRRSSVAVDLRDDWASALLGAGLDTGHPVAWIAEGLLAYLNPDARRALLASISDLACPGSRVALDHIVGDPAAGGRLTAMAERSRLPMDRLIVGGEGDDPARLLATAGWQAETASVDEVARLYGRDLSDPFAPPGVQPATEPPWLETTFVTAVLDAVS